MECTLTLTPIPTPTPKSKNINAKIIIKVNNKISTNTRVKAKVNAQGKTKIKTKIKAKAKGKIIFKARIITNNRANAQVSTNVEATTRFTKSIVKVGTLLNQQTTTLDDLMYFAINNMANLGVKLGGKCNDKSFVMFKFVQKGSHLRYGIVKIT